MDRTLRELNEKEKKTWKIVKHAVTNKMKQKAIITKLKGLDLSLE